MSAKWILASGRLLLFTVMLFVCSITQANDSVNLTEIKNKLIKYHDSGVYYRDISETLKEAMYYLEFRINQNNRSKHPQKMAIVF